MSENPLRPVHAGEILHEEFLAPLGLTPNGLASALRVPRPRIERLVRAQTPVTADTALRLALFRDDGRILARHPVTL